MTTQAQKEANKRYKAKTKQIMVKYSIQEMEEYRRAEQHCHEMDITYQRYVKDLIRKDLDRIEQGKTSKN